MLKVMIVDDEPIILDKLRYGIDWAANGCEIIAEANDSAKALKLAVEFRPEIIFSDICMPLMNGIELADAIRQNLPQSVVILISGYDDFGFAQQAIESGVFRYLLKPINNEILLKVLEEAKSYLALREQEIREKEILRNQIKNSLPRLREKFFTDLINKDISRELLAQQLQFLELNPLSDLYSVINIHPDDYHNLTTALKEEEFQIYRTHLLNMLQNNLQENTSFLFGFQNKPGELIIIYGINSERDQDLIFQGIQKTQENSDEMYGITFSAGIGRLYSDFYRLSLSYREASLALDFKLWAGKRVIIPYNDIENTQSGHLFFHPDYDGFITILRSGSLEKVNDFIDKIFRAFKAKEYASRSFLHLTMLGLINQMIRCLMEFNISFEEVFRPSFDPFQEVNSLETLSDMENWFRELTRNTITYIHQHKQDVSKNFVEKAKIYLEKNYTDPTLNLTKVAENVYVSSCYLSHLFKEITGSTVIEYLNKIRIKAAKKMLKETQLKVYEIAEQAGFNDYHYFGIVFKKITGLSPLEYRDKVQFDNLI